MDWGSILIGVLLTIPASIAAIILYNRITNYFDRRRIVVSERNKARVIRRYIFVKKLVDREEDVYIYMFSSVISVSLGMPIGTAFIIFAILIPVTSEFDPLRDYSPAFLYTDSFTAAISLMAFLIGVGFISISTWVASRAASVIRRYRRFDEYTDEIEKAFGPDAITEAISRPADGSTR